METPYPYLPEGRNIQYVNADNEFIQRARQLALNYAVDQQHPTGAVVVKDGSVIGEGYNYAPIAVIPHLVKTHKKWCLRRLFGVPSGQKYWLCPGCTNNRDHAEVRSIRDTRNRNNDPTGADLYLWGHWWCCKPCWDAMIEAGIKNVYLLEESQTLFNR